MTASVANVNTGYLPRNPRIGCGVEGKTLSVDVRLVEDMISYFHRQRQIFLEGISRESNWDAIWLELVASPTDTTVASVSVSHTCILPLPHGLVSVFLFFHEG